jgi:hypothetical protein
MGGRDQLSEAQLSLIKRAAAMECELEQMEGKLSMGESVDMDVFARVTGHLRRTLETLGIERRPRDITPSLPRYLTDRALRPPIDALAEPTDVADESSGPSLASAAVPHTGDGARGAG